MSEKHVILIHGTWCNGENWGEFATALREQGYTVHTPTWPYHGNPRTHDIWGNAQQVRTLGLLDYVAGLKTLADSLDSAPIIIGHSVGALIAQLLAARVRCSGVVLLGPAPTAGMIPIGLSMYKLWARYLPQWIASKPMYPVSFKAWNKYICNATPPEVSEAYYTTLCAESGTAYRQMILWFLDPSRAARVDFASITAPVLVITGSRDLCTRPSVGRATVKRYRPGQAAYAELEGADHMMTTGPFMSRTLEVIRSWTETNDLLPPQKSAV